jgi:Lipocalin-like domain
MNRLSMVILTSLALLCLGIAPRSGEGPGQANINKDQLVGTWMYVSVLVERSDGSKEETWGPKPEGILILTADGHYSLQLIGPALPKIASKDRLKTTHEENQAIAHGVVSHFGSYSVNEADGTLILHVKVSSFANDDGIDQKRIVTSLSADEMKWTNPTPTTPGTAYAVLKRVK